jgi:hypothetical protein
LAYCAGGLSRLDLSHSLTKNIYQMKKLYLVISLFLFATVKNSDAQLMFQKVWGGTGADNVYGIAQASGGGYYLTGSTGSFGTAGNAAFILKLDASGNLAWTKIIGGTVSDGIGFVTNTSDGGCVISGATSSYGAGGQDAAVIKLDASGNIQWMKVFGGAGDEGTNEVIQANDGGYAVVGNTTSFGNGGTDMFVAKLTGAGALQWVKAFGGSGEDQGIGIAQNADKTYYIGGHTNSFGAGSYDMLMAKLDSSGNLLWTKTIGGSNTDKCWGTTRCADGGFVLGGYTTSFGAGSYDTYVVKFDAAGVLKWTRTVGGTGTESAYGVTETADGGYVFSGVATSFGGLADVYIGKLNGGGVLQWTKTIGSTDYESTNQIIETSDGGLAASGVTKSYGSGDYDVFIVKMQGTGNICNAGTAGGSPGSGGTVGSGGVIVDGSFSITTASPPVISGGTFSSICTTIGINEIDFASMISVSPNPSHGHFTIRISDTFLLNNCTVDVYNIVGEKICSQKIEQAFTPVTLPAAAGIYMMKFMSEGKVYTQRVVVQ